MQNNTNDDRTAQGLTNYGDAEFSLFLHAERGYLNLFLGSILGANQGCGFDFMVPKIEARVPESET